MYFCLISYFTVLVTIEIYKPAFSAEEQISRGKAISVEIMAWGCDVFVFFKSRMATGSYHIGRQVSVLLCCSQSWSKGKWLTPHDINLKVRATSDLKTDVWFLKLKDKKKKKICISLFWFYA